MLAEGAGYHTGGLDVILLENRVGHFRFDNTVSRGVTSLSTEVLSALQEESNKQSTETVKSVSRRSSDEIPDAIDNADDLVDADEKKEVTSGPEVNEVRAEAKTSVDSDNFYSSNTERESSPSDRACRVNVLRSIPGDDSGLGEELVLVISKDQLEEVERRGAVRARWFLHSLQQLDLVDKPETRGAADSHVAGDRVRTVMMFNTVRKDLRQREYVMSEAGYSTLMALLGSVLEAAAVACSSLPSLQCVKCQAVFSSTDKCPQCGSSMVLEREDTRPEGEEEELCLGIPACEMLDLEAITEAAGAEREESQQKEVEVSEEVGRAMSVTADIQQHLVTSSHRDNLPDLLPRPEPTRSVSPAMEEKRDSESKEKSFSPNVTRSNSSSDISVISSEASIEVIPSKVKTPTLLAPAEALTKTSAVSPVLGRMADSDSSESSQLVDSTLGLESCRSPSTPSVFKTPVSTPVKKEVTPPSSNYSTCT